MGSIDEVSKAIGELSASQRSMHKRLDNLDEVLNRIDGKLITMHDLPDRVKEHAEALSGLKGLAAVVDAHENDIKKVKSTAFKVLIGVAGGSFITGSSLGAYIDAGLRKLGLK